MNLQNLKTYDFFYWFAWPALRPAWASGVRVERIVGVRDALGAERVAELETHWARFVHSSTAGSSSSPSAAACASPLFSVALVPRSSSSSSAAAGLRVLSLAECRRATETLADHEVRLRLCNACNAIICN